MSSQRIPKEQRLSKEQLQKIINRSQTVIGGLEDNSAWSIVLEDFGNQSKNLDDNWQFVNDEKKMLEFRITKLACMSVLKLVENYKFNMKKAMQELATNINPEGSIEKDVDNEGQEDSTEEAS